MDFTVLRPRTPPKKVLGDEFRLKRHRAPRMPTDGCHLAVCSLCVRIFFIEVIFLAARQSIKIARAFLYRVGPRILSSTFCRTRPNPMDHQLDHYSDNSGPSMSCLRSSSTKNKIRQCPDLGNNTQCPTCFRVALQLVVRTGTVNVRR